MADLLKQIRACQICKAHLPLPPRPVLQASSESRIAIIGQAPGKRAHDSGIPWDDPSGVRLRAWLGITANEFYDPKLFAIIPMGFCYPGKAPTGDLPPRPECAPRWHGNLWELLPHVHTVLLFGSYAQAYYLGAAKQRTLTLTVRAWETYQPRFLPMPHPSPLNNLWLKKNPWFEQESLPAIKKVVRAAIDGNFAPAENQLQIKRAYEAPAVKDGYRVLVDRLWPRGVKKADLALHEWAKVLAPSTELRQEFDHDVAGWSAFQARYKAELRAGEAKAKIKDLAGRAKGGPVTLVYGAKDQTHNNAVVLMEILKQL